ncbi:MAG: fibronectin type III domain-containing protein, partial [Bacteroidales bacterium]|nr:fibronectin type III domain-containing protein [Bacteroidales bacterium]
MKKALSLLLFAALALSSAWAQINYDFGSVAPSGQTLYYNIIDSSNHTVEVVAPNRHTYWNGQAAYYWTIEPTGSITIPSTVSDNGTTFSVIRIGDHVFDSCYQITGVIIPNSVTAIGNYAFSECRNLTNVSIPNSVRTIGNNAFYSVRHIVYYGPASGGPWGAQHINGYVDGYLIYTDRNKTTLIVCDPRATAVNIPHSVNVIDNSAFSGCINLTSVTIPDSVTAIGDNAFYGCSGLTSITIPNSVTSIGNSAFSYCSGLADVNIPNSVTSIGSSAFSYCSGLTSVSIPNSVTSIGSYAFYYCRNLSEIISESGTAPSLGYSPFYQVPSSIPVHIPCGSTASYSSSWSYFSNFVEDVPIHVPFTESFDTWSTVLTDPLPNCWEKHTNYSKSYPCASTTYAHTGSKSLYMYSTSSTYSYIVLPQTDIDINQLKISFWLYRPNSTYSHPVRVGVMTDPSNVSTFTQIASVQCSRTGAWEQFEVPLYNYRGAGSYIAIMSPNGTASNPYLDDLTVTAAASIPYACNFESNGTNGWELVNGTQTNAWYVGSSVTVDSTTSPDPAAGYCGSKSLYISYNSGSSNYYSLNSTSYTYAKRTIKIEEDGNYIVNFDWKCPGWNSYNSYIRAFIIPVSQDNLVAGFAPNGGRAYSFANWNEPSGWKDLSGKSQAPYTLTGESNWQNHKDTVTLYAGIYNLVFTWANDSDSIYTTSPAAAIDNVSITAQPCPDISNLEATATSTEVTLTWNDGGIHSSWTINCAGRTHHTTDTFYTITGLIPNTEYYAHVYPDCRVNDSNYLSYIRFYTACTSISEQDLPYTENFDSYTSSTTTLTNVEPSCWTLAHQDVAMTDEYKPMIYYSADAHSGWYSLLLNKRCIYAMPKYEGDVSTLRLSMNVRQGNLNNQLIVGVMSDLDNDSTFDPVTTIDNTSTNSEFVIIDFNSYSGNGQYIAFRNTNSNANSEWGINFIDDITLELLPITPITEDTCSIKIADLPYSEDFDSYTASTSPKTGVEPTCWTRAYDYVTITDANKPQ